MKRMIRGTSLSLVLLLCLLAMLESRGAVAVGQARTEVRKPEDERPGKHPPVTSDDLKDQQAAKKAARGFRGETSDQKQAKLASSTVSLAPRKVDTSKKIHLNPPPPKPSNSATSSSASAWAPKQGLTKPKPHREDSEAKEPAGPEEPHHPPHPHKPHATGCSSLDSRDAVEKCKEAESRFRSAGRKK